jgi:hypothetical protein
MRAMTLWKLPRGILALGLLIFASLCCAPITARSQDTPTPTSSLVISVVDNLGNAVPGAHVTLKGTKDFSAQTDSGGTAHFDQLPFGTYAALVDKPGFNAFSAQGLWPIRRQASVRTASNFSIWR